MSKQTITSQQFAALVALTSIRPGKHTHEALRRHLVLGMSKPQAAHLSGISLQVLYRALDTLDKAARNAREYVRLTPAETSEASSPAAAPPAARCTGA